MQVHGRLILLESMLIYDPYFVDPSQLVTELFSSEKKKLEAFSVRINYSLLIEGKTIMSNK